MKASPGMRIKMSFDRADKALIAKFNNIPVANIGDATARLLTMDARLRAMGRGTRLLGSALTVHSALADNAMFHKALSMAKEGDVIVVNASGDCNHSVCGDVMYRYAISRGVAGFVVDGCVRDIDFLQAHDFPVFAIGATPRGPYKIPVGEINMPIACGGQVVAPGDLIVGDKDGVTVVRKEDIATVYDKVQAIMANEALMSDLIKNGEWEERSPILTAVEQTITEKGFEIIK